MQALEDSGVSNYSFDEIKALKGRLDNLAGAMTPGRFYKLAV